jgi:hypothetical protein
VGHFLISVVGVTSAATRVAWWRPSTASGLRLWLDAALGVSVDGPDVLGWTDQSSLGNNGAFGAAPLFEATGWNGTGPAVLLNGESSGHYLTFDAGTIPADLSGNDTGLHRDARRPSHVESDG